LTWSLPPTSTLFPYTTLFRSRRVPMRVVAQVEHHLQFARDHVVGAGTGVDVANLQAGRREAFVALVPRPRTQLGQRRRGLVDGGARLVRIGDVALHAAHGEGAGVGAVRGPVRSRLWPTRWRSPGWAVEGGARVMRQAMRVHRWGKGSPPRRRASLASPCSSELSRRATVGG